MSDIDFMRSVGNPTIALEREMMVNAHAVHAISNAILRDVETIYNLSLKGQATIIPLGITDTLAPEPWSNPRAR